MKLPVGFRAAVPADADALLDLVEAFYREEGYPFERPGARRALIALVRSPARGWVWVIERGSRPVGYVVVTLGYSLEYRGATVLVDELYLSPEHRGRGLGSKTLALVERAAASSGVRVVQLEVERSNAGADALYRRCGFADRGRALLTKKLGARDDSGTTRRGPGGRTSPSTRRGERGRRA
jgi:ribosomal protein S18 acetylase RimI-like enzyme